MRKLTCLLMLQMLTALPVRAELAVVTDVGPVASLVAMVTGSGDIRPLVGAGQDPHGMSLRPSDIRAIGAADLVVWIGPQAEPWLAQVARRSDAISVTLPDALCARDGVQTCPDHPWIDPILMGRWLDVIARAAGRADPEGAGTYQSRAAQWQEALRGLDDDTRAILRPVAARPFLGEHDAFGAFSHRYSLNQAGALSDSEAEAPSVARRAETEKLLARLGPICLFSTEDPAGAIARQLDSEGKAKLRSVNILAAGEPVTPQLYPDMIRTLAADMADCLSDDTGQASQ